MLDFNQGAWLPSYATRIRRLSQATSADVRTIGRDSTRVISDVTLFGVRCRVLHSGRDFAGMHRAKRRPPELPISRTVPESKTSAANALEQPSQVAPSWTPVRQ